MPTGDLTYPETQLNLVLFPHRSFKPEHFTKLLLILLVLCGAGAIRFSMVGAWPVAVFLLVDLFAIWFAFYLNNRRARVCETIELTETRLKVRRTAPNGHVESWAFEPYWVKVRIKKDPTYTNCLELSLHDQTVTLGSFLTPSERESLHEKLSGALVKWKNRQPALQ